MGVISSLVVAALLFAPTAGSSGAPASNQPLGVEHYLLTRNGGGLGFDLQETDIFYLRQSGAHPQWSIERLRTERGPSGRTTVHDWILGEHCPALGEVMKALPQARNLAHASDDPKVMVTDTPATKLVTTSNGWYVTDEQTEFRGPLVEWWTAAEKSLSSCWTERLH